MEELSYVLIQYFVSCVHVRFYFSLSLIFTLLAASISHCLTAALNFHVFLSTKFVSFVFNHSLLLFLSNNVDVVVFFFLKVLAAMRFFPNKTLSCIWVSIPVDRIILHWYAWGADGRSGGRCTVTWLPNFLEWVVYHISYPWCSAARASRGRAPLSFSLQRNWVNKLLYCWSFPVLLSRKSESWSKSCERRSCGLADLVKTYIILINQQEENPLISMMDWEHGINQNNHYYINKHILGWMN